ncbi:13128_t:CDS:2, partial [Entrophospora sp. SA101]
MTRKDKKNRTCDRCGYICATPQMLRAHLNRKNPCRPRNIDPIPTPTNIPIQIPEPIRDTETSITSDTLFSDQKVEWEYQNVKRKLGKFENLQLECCIPKEFTRQRFYSEIEREGLGELKGQLSSKWVSVIYEAIQGLQQYLRGKKVKVSRKDVVDYIRKSLPIPQIDSEAGPGPSTQAHREKISQSKDSLDSNNESNITQEEIDLLIALGLIEEPEIEESWPELGGTLLADKAKSKKFKSHYRDSGFDSIAVKAPSGDIIFEEAEVGDPDRQHSSLSSLSKWQAIVPSYENPAYAFNTPIDDPEKYAEAPYMPQLIASAREQITSVLKAELRRKDQIKSAIVVYCNYMKMEKKGEDEHITLSAGEIDAKIERFLNNGSGWTLIRIEMIYIEVYAFRRAVGGSFKPTPKNLANTKCTINPDNSKTGDDMCLKYAFGPYFATLDGITKNLQRLSVIKPYLNIVNLDGIPMPTPICPRTFQKIEAQNPEISINVWEWKEETATPKPVIASKNFYIPNSCQVAGCEHPRPNECMTKRPHVIHLMALTDVNKSEDTGKYGQRNHFLWIKNKDGLIRKDTKHNDKKYLCNRCFQGFPSENTRDYHQDHCYGLGEAPQVVTLPKKDINDIEKFKHYARMMFAPCVIVADFESKNKKCDESYGGSMRKLGEQVPSSFCYSVHWIDTGEVWGPFTYRGPNATQEFVRRMDKELVKINEVLEINNDIRDDIIFEVDNKTKTEYLIAKQKFDESTECWIYGSTRSKHKGVSKSGMNKMATNTYFPSLGGSLLDDSIPPNKIFDPMTLVYRDCLFGNEVFYAMNIGFRSKDHILSMVESEKKALCPLNSKNWVLSDGITPWAYGHWRIDAYKSMVKAGISPEMAEKRAIVAQHHPTLENKYM